MATNSPTSYSKRAKDAVDHICVDLGTGGLRMACSNEGNDHCREIGNYPAAQAGTPSLVPQAPSRIIYEPSINEPAKPIAFGHTRPRRNQTLVSGVKIALLPHPESYGYVHSLLVDAVDNLRLTSIQQIPEDFLRFAIEHAIKESGGQPKNGWAFSVPQYYNIEEVQNFRTLLRRAGCIGNIYIHGESDCVTYANLAAIEGIIGEERDVAFKNGKNFTIAVGIFDLGAGTADITTCEICFKFDGTPPTINELRAPLGFAIGGDLFDERFIQLLRSKLNINMSPDQEQAFFEPFVERFHKQSKPQWSTDFEDEVYPFHVPDGKARFTLTVDDMACIMDPPIDESCRRIGEHLVRLTKPLDLVVISGGNSEAPGMIPRLRAMLRAKSIVSDDDKVIHLTGQSSNAVVRGLHYWINHPQLVKGRYARMTLARVVKRPCTELAGEIKVPAEDAGVRNFYDCAERIMTEGVLVPNGIQNVVIYYDIEANTDTLNILPIDVCIPNKDAISYTSGARIWNFASECKRVGTIDLEPTLADIKITSLRKSPVKGKRRLWLRLSVEVDMDIAVVVSWRSNGCQVKDDADLCSAKLILNSLDMPNQVLLNDFRAPIRQRESSDSSISNDTLLGHLEKLKSDSHARIISPKAASSNTDSDSSNVDTGSSIANHLAPLPRSDVGDHLTSGSDPQTAPHQLDELSPATAPISHHGSAVAYPTRKRNFSEVQEDPSLSQSPSSYQPSSDHRNQMNHIRHTFPSGTQASGFQQTPTTPYYSPYNEPQPANLAYAFPPVSFPLSSPSQGYLPSTTVSTASTLPDNPQYYPSVGYPTQRPATSICSENAPIGSWYNPSTGVYPRTNEMPPSNSSGWTDPQTFDGGGMNRDSLEIRQGKETQWPGMSLLGPNQVRVPSKNPSKSNWQD